MLFFEFGNSYFFILPNVGGSMSNHVCVCVFVVLMNVLFVFGGVSGETQFGLENMISNTFCSDFCSVPN